VSSADRHPPGGRSGEDGLTPAPHGPSPLEDRLGEAELRTLQRLGVLGRLSEGVAHDFNNVLMAVLGGAEIALGKLPGTHPARPYVEAVRASAERGRAVANRLLALGTPAEAGADAGGGVVVDEILERSQPLLRALLNDDVHLHLALSAPGLAVATTAPRLEELVLHLCLNAREAMPNGGTLVLATHRPGPEPGDDGMGPPSPEPAGDDGTLLLTVADDGLGMSAATRGRALEPFFTTRPERGAGLGLAIVHRIVDEAGGEVSLSSEVGLGTVVRVRLPLADALPVEGPGRRHRRRVLLVEDHAPSREALRELLEDLGWEVLAAGTAAQALQLAARVVGDGGVDAVVSDLSLPDESGDLLVGRLRRRQPELPVVFLTGHDPRDRPELRRLVGPTTRLLVKPVELDDLARELDGLVHRPGLAGPHPAYG